MLRSAAQRRVEQLSSLLRDAPGRCPGAPEHDERGWVAATHGRRVAAPGVPGAKTPTPGHYEPGAVGLLGSSGSPRVVPGPPRDRNRRAGTRTSRQEPRGTPGGTWHTTKTRFQGRRTGVPLPHGDQDRSLNRPVMTDPGPGRDGACPSLRGARAPKDPGARAAGSIRCARNDEWETPPRIPT